MPLWSLTSAGERGPTDTRSAMRSGGERCPYSGQATALGNRRGVVREPQAARQPKAWLTYAFWTMAR